MNNAVNGNVGAHAYTFLQKFTDNSGNSPLTNIRVASSTATRRITSPKATAFPV